MNSNNQQTLGKAVLVARLNAIIRRMEKDRDAYLTSHKKTRDAETGQTPLTRFQEDMKDAQHSLEALYREVNASLVEETTIGREYNKETFDATLRVVRAKVLERFSHFPMAAAMLETFILFLEAQLTLNAHFLNLRTHCGVEERKNDPSEYGLNGEPKN